MLNKYFFLVLLISVTEILYADGFLRFVHVTSADGLSQNTVNTIFKDHRGFMWFGTNDGLNRFDGRNYRIFQQNHTDSNSIGANGITSIAEDQDNRLWIGTKQNGISIYYPEEDSFVILNSRNKKPGLLSGNYVAGISFIEPNTILAGFANKTIDVINTKTLAVKSLTLPSKEDSVLRIVKFSFAKDSLGNIWVGSDSYGLFLLDTIKNTLTKIPLIATHRKDWPGKEPVGITDIKVLDKKHLILATFRTGILIFNIEDYSYKQITLNKYKGISGNYNITNSLEIINDSIIWATTMDIGLVELNLHTGKKKYYNTSTHNNNFDYNGLLDIYKDSQGIIWLGSNGMGLYYYNPQLSFFVTISKESDLHKYSLHFNSVRSIYKTGSNLYVGGYKGLDYIDLRNEKCTQIYDLIIPYYMTELPGDTGFLWIASEVRKDLKRLNLQNKKIETIKISNLVTKDQWFPFFKILPINDSLAWLGCREGKLILINYKTRKQVKVFSPNTIPGFVHGNVLALYLRGTDELWVGSTTDGIVVINPGNGKIIHRFTDNNTSSPAYFVNAVKTIIEDHNGNIWVGTGNGLYNYIDSTASFKGYFTSDGLPNNTVYGILEDRKGNLWLSTNKGISVFNRERELFINFDSKFELKNSEFNTNAYFKDSTGFFCFGGIKGITLFYPDNFKWDTINTKTQITRIELNDMPLKYSLLNQKQPIVIPSGTRDVMIEFAGLNYLNPYSIDYRYKVNNEKWTFIGNDNSINLGFPRYGINKITINATNTHGQWSKYNTSVVFDFEKPFYLRVWFFVLIIFLITFLVAAYFSRRTGVLRKRQKLLENKINLATKDLLKTQAELENEIKHKETIENELRESNATKSKMFSIIGHDLINPFNALLGFSNLLKESIDSDSKKELKSYANVMAETSLTLYNMVQNILTWSRAQQNKITPVPELVKVRQLVQTIFYTQNQHASSKGIKLLNNVPEYVEALFDKNMLEIVLRNLISNAIKFSYRDSSIEISANYHNNNVIINVTDSGVGMDKTNVNSLFNPDKNFKTEGTNNERGTGLGLILVKEFIDKNGASISVESEVGKGTKFTLVLKSAKDNDDIGG